MKYANGETVRRGDQVLLDKSVAGKVVFCIESGEFDDQFPRDEWKYLERGTMIQFDGLGLVLYDNEIEAGVELVSRLSQG